jgi:hypothetical protein
MGTIVISLETHWNTGKKTVGEPGNGTKSTQKSHTQCKSHLDSCGVSLRGFHMIQDSSDVAEQSSSLDCEYDVWIIVHYHFGIIQAIMFFNIVFLARQH